MRRLRGSYYLRCSRYCHNPCSFTHMSESLSRSRSQARWSGRTDLPQLSILQCITWQTSPIYSKQHPSRLLLQYLTAVSLWSNKLCPSSCASFELHLLAGKSRDSSATGSCDPCQLCVYSAEAQSSEAATMRTMRSSRRRRRTRRVVGCAFLSEQPTVVILATLAIKPCGITHHNPSMLCVCPSWRGRFLFDQRFARPFSSRDRSSS